jgi:hypothetical protein
MGYPAVRIFIKFEIMHEVFTATPSLIDERSSSRSDNWHSESEQRSRGCFGEGGCAARRLHPIGLTASGEIVFPIQCRELIERERGKTMEQKPFAVEQKPAAKQSESEDVTPMNSQGAIKRVETIAKRVEPKRREPAISGCRHFRTYDAATRTYTNYGGHRRPCR